MFTLNLSVYEGALDAIVILSGIGFVTAIVALINFLFSDDYEKRRCGLRIISTAIACIVLWVGGLIICRARTNYVNYQFEEEFEENVRNTWFEKNEVVVETDDNIYVFTHVAGSNYEVEVKQK